MEKRFSNYLTEIGLLNETASSSLLKKDDKLSNKSFADTSFECLKNYFNNLDEDQKNYMSLCIPSKFLEISYKEKKTKLKSIIIQLIIRKRFILFKYFIIWKKNIYLLEKYTNSYNPNNINIQIDNINNNNNGNEVIINRIKNVKDSDKDDNSEINYGENLFNNIANKYLDNQNNNRNNYGDNNININVDDYKNNISTYNLVNIDSNIDVDNKNITKTEEEEKAKIISSSYQNNSISFANLMLKNNYNKNKNNFKKKINVKNIKNIKNININKNKNNTSIQSNISDINNNNNIKINNNNKNQVNINSYKTINTSNYRKHSNRSQNSTNNNNNSSIRNSNVKNHLHTSLEEKEIRELKECTFKPKINQTKKLSKRTLSQNDINSSLVIPNSIDNNRQKREEEIQLIFEKLYKDSEKYKLSKEMKAIEVEHMMSRKAPFIPNIKKKIKKSLNKKRQKSEGNFEERQQQYLNKKNKRSAKIKNKINSEFEEICSFNPKITNDKGEYYQITKKEKINKKPVFIRLYEDNKDRKNFYLKKEAENMNKIMDLSNILNPQKNFNFETINRLHENKEKRDIMNKTRKKVEEEEGVTFTPYISEDIYIRKVNGNFYERSKKLLNDRESFYEEENKKYQDGLRNSVEKKGYTKEERKKIIDNIINRLYNDSVHINKKPVNNEKMRNFRSYCE